MKSLSENRVAFIGDVHGCYVELMELLTTIGFYEGKIDKLIFVGDLIDKGPNPKEVIEFCKTWASCCEFVMGNHEEKHVRFHMHERKAKKNPRYTNPMKVHEDFLRTRNELLKITLFDPFKFMDEMKPYFYVLDDAQHLVIHGGLLPGEKAEYMHPKLLTRVRYVKSDNTMAALDEIDATMPFWTDLYKGPEKIVYGHQPWLEPEVSENTIGIDTGCVHGNKLCAYVVPEEKFYFSKARKTYSPLHVTSPGYKTIASWP